MPDHLGQSDPTDPKATMDIDIRITLDLADDAIVMPEHELTQALEDALLDQDVVSNPTAWAVIKHAQVLHAYDRRLNKVASEDQRELDLDGRGIEERRSLEL